MESFWVMASVSQQWEKCLFPSESVYGWENKVHWVTAMIGIRKGIWPSRNSRLTQVILRVTAKLVPVCMCLWHPCHYWVDTVGHNEGHLDCKNTILSVSLEDQDWLTNPGECEEIWCLSRTLGRRCLCVAVQAVFVHWVSWVFEERRRCR